MFDLRFTPYLICFFFALLGVIYGAWFYLAQSSYSGVISGVQYSKGLYSRYSPYLDHHEHKLPFNYNLYSSASHDEKYVHFEIMPENGRSVKIYAATLDIMSPVTSKYDKSVEMNKLAEYKYGATFACRNGQWDIKISLDTSEGKYIIQERVLLYDQKFRN